MASGVAMCRTWLAATLAFTAALIASAFAQETPSKFCSELTRQIVSPWDKSIYYRSPNTRAITQLNTVDKIYRHLNQQLFYFRQSSDANIGRPGVLNIKVVYLLKPKLKPTSSVGVNNDQWDNLSDADKARISNACAHLTVEGYERFHLANGRNYCLGFLFHQRTPFNTLATLERRRSFAFGDMIPGSDAPLQNPLVAFWSFIARAQAAEQTGTSLDTAPLSYAHSVIRNFKFAGMAGQCVEIRSLSPPQDAASLRLRITDLGTDPSDSPVSNDWFLNIDQ
jgi:hypothetical protein